MVGRSGWGGGQASERRLCMPTPDLSCLSWADQWAYQSRVWKVLFMIPRLWVRTRVTSNTRVHNSSAEVRSDHILLYAKGKGKGICLESRYPCDYTCSSYFTSPGSGHTAACNCWSNLISVHQVPIIVGWTASSECKVCLTLLHMASTGNRTPDLVILSPTPNPLGHMLTYPVQDIYLIPCNYHYGPRSWLLISLIQSLHERINNHSFQETNTQ